MSTLRVSHVKTRDDVVWVVFLCCGVCVCVCVCVSRPCEAQRESPARPRPSRSISRVRILTSSFLRIVSAATLQQTAKFATSALRVACVGTTQARGAPPLPRKVCEARA